MPRYEYLCPKNKITAEVVHPMNKKINTWGELARLAKLPLGKTSANAPVQRVFSVPNIFVPVGNSKLKELKASHSKEIPMHLSGLLQCNKTRQEN